MKKSSRKTMMWVQASLNHKQYQGKQYQENGTVNLKPLPNKIISKLKKVFNF